MGTSVVSFSDSLGGAATFCLRVPQSGASLCTQAVLQRGHASQGGATV